MLILIKLIGIIIVVMGIIFLLNPKALKQYIAFWMQGKRIRAASILNIALGIIFLLSASRCRLTGVVLIMGILTLLKGILAFTLGVEKFKSMIKWWDKKSFLALRLLSLLVIAIGVLFIYSA